MNKVSQLPSTLKTGDMVKLILPNGSITGRIEEYRQDVEALEISDVCFSGICLCLPCMFTISTYLILELVKL